MSETKTEQNITKEYNGNTYTTGETWKSKLSDAQGVIVGFTKEGKPIIELPRGGIDVLLNPEWVKNTKTKYYIYRGYDGNLAITNHEISESLHEFTLEE